jgi:hypothetical protein
MKRILKYLTYIFVVLLVLCFFLAKFSSVETHFKCTGEITKGNVIQGSKTVFIKLNEYRPWVGLWSSSHGSVNLEIPNQWFDYFEQVDIVGDQLQIYTNYPEKTLKGNFSKLSKTLSIDTPYGVFEGGCTQN